MSATKSTDTKLLPFTEYLRSLPAHCRGRIDAYARANVSHATAPLQAEIEALRVEVAAQRTRADAMAGEAIKHEARAERLAEALREAKEAMLSQVEWEACDCGCPQGRKPTDAVSVTWLRAVQQVEVATARAEEGE